jgi:hypothetical protein
LGQLDPKVKALGNNGGDHDEKVRLSSSERSWNGTPSGPALL